MQPLGKGSCPRPGNNRVCGLLTELRPPPATAAAAQATGLAVGATNSTGRQEAHPGRTDLSPRAWSSEPWLKVPGRRTGRFSFSLFHRECSCPPLNHLKDFLKIPFKTHNLSSTESSHVFMNLQAQLLVFLGLLCSHTKLLSHPQ